MTNDLNWDTIGWPAPPTRVFAAGPDRFMHFPLKEEPRVKEPPKREPSSWDKLAEERRRYG